MPAYAPRAPAARLWKLGSKTHTLTLLAPLATPLRTTGNRVSLYAQARISHSVAGALFLPDFLKLNVHPSGLANALLVTKTPQGKFHEAKVAADLL
jgi:hypothetical protein